MNINKIVKTRLNLLKNSNYDFKSIFEIIHSDKDLIFCEKTDGFRIKKTTYNECYIYSYKMATYLKGLLNDDSEYVGLMMENRLEFITSLYGILMNNKKPVLLNVRLGSKLINEIIERLQIKDIVCDNDYDILGNKINVSNFDYDSIVNFNKEEFIWANEIALCTSATSLNVKICIYDGKAICTQITNSDLICKRNKDIKNHYHGYLKQLAFLPFYHIFGLMASYFWFAFFGRCFVFLKDLSSDTIIRTIKKHEVTHIFAVPMLWHTVHKTLIREINKQDEKTINKFYKGLKLSNKLQSIFPRLGLKITKKLFKEVRTKVFGESVQFMISGGSYLSHDASYVINGIGYPLFNGYGMTEIGITSVELSYNANTRIKRFIGRPFETVEYKINEDSQLLVKSDGICSKIITKDNLIEINHREYFNTFDIVKKDKNGNYIIEGRTDDVVLTSNGEKINPDVIEAIINLPSVERFSLLGLEENNLNYLTLVLELNNSLSEIRINQINKEVKEVLDNLRANNYNIDKVYYTFDRIISLTAVKVSRKLLTRWINEGIVNLHPFSDLKVIKLDDINEVTLKIIDEVKTIFKELLNSNDDIDINAHFILDLGATSLDYLTLLVKLEEKYDIKFNNNIEPNYTILQFATYIVGKIN
jgi:acyl carrier protein